ncbi:hypothetical protein [Streptosporangium sp. H16]
MQTFIDAVVSLCNTAQIDVLTRVGILAHQQLREDAEGDTGAD